MTGILNNTPGTKFTVKDAQERAQSNTNKSGGGWKSLFDNDGDLLNQFNQSVNNFGNKASQWWNGVKSLF